MPSCGTQCWLCDLPVRFDTYSGCSHLCSYCFASRKGKIDLTNVRNAESVESLKKFVEGIRSGKTTSRETNWLDWEIPLHWGGLSDPFQYIERERKRSLECLKYLAECQYPFVVSTKGTQVLNQPEYLEQLEKCKAVVQVSMVCSSYDAFEPGAPKYEQRLKDIAEISNHCLRTIVRIQPYIPQYKEEIKANLPRLKEAGVYGIIIEGFKTDLARKGMVRLGSEFVYPYETLVKDFLEFKDLAHSLGLRIFAGENRIRELGDSLTCCGTENLEDFKPNEYNLNHILHGHKTEPTERMKEPRTAECFRPCFQDSINGKFVREQSFAYMMGWFYKNKKALVFPTFGMGDNRI